MLQAEEQLQPTGEHKMTLKHSLTRRKVLTGLGGVALTPSMPLATAQAFPIKPIKILIGVPPAARRTC